MSQMTVIIKMPLVEQRELLKSMEEYSKAVTPSEKEEIFNNARDKINSLLDTSFHDGLYCRVEKALEKDDNEPKIVTDKNVLLMKPEEEKEEN